MAIGDLLRGIGSGVATAGRVAGAVLEPLGERTAQVVSGEAPQIDEEKRQQQMQISDEQRAVKANELEAQLEMGRKYGTLTPEQQKQYVDAITGLYSKPEHQGSLLQRIHQAIHPQGAFRQTTQPLPSAVPAGGTAVADQSLAMGNLLKTPQGAAIESYMQTHPGSSYDESFAAVYQQQHPHAPTVPKPLESKIAGNVFLGVTDPNTGKMYGISDLQPGGNAPPEAKSLYQEYEKGRQVQQAQKEKDRKAENDAIMKRQEITNANMLERMQLQFKNMLSMGNFRSANNVVQGLEKQYTNSLDLESKMHQLAGQAFVDGKPNQQAQLAILANHIAMTTHQPGAAMRPTKALFDEAAAAQPWMQKIKKTFDSDGYLVGVVLSSQQIQQMVDLATVMVNADLQALNQTKQLLSDQLTPDAATPGKKTGAKKVGSLLPKTTQSGDSSVDKFLKSF